MTTEPRHFDLVPADFTGDIDFQIMTATERGIYCTIIFYMYQSGGYCKLDRVAIATLCNCNGDFDKAWENVSKKFKTCKNGIYHKRVLSEYKKSEQRMQAASNAGLRGAQKRWQGYSNPNGEPNTKLSKVKVSKGKCITTHNDLAWQEVVEAKRRQDELDEKARLKGVKL